MAEGSRAIRLAWMEVDSATGRLTLSWQAQQPDGSWGQETATVEPGQGHPLLERCKALSQTSPAGHEALRRITDKARSNASG
jgi:hypothetical protein